MAEPETPGTPEPAPEKPAKAPRAKAAEAPGPGINATITGDPHGLRQEPDLDPSDPGINANVVS